MSNCLLPRIIDENEDYAVVYKPPEMHCAPLKTSETGTLVNWFSDICQAHVKGRKLIEGGLLHRLDYSTCGLVLFAKNQAAFDYFQNEQKEGRIIKEYQALCNKTAIPLPGFPVCNFNDIPEFIESNFRSYGRGRKAVRPVLETKHRFYKIASDNEEYYKTEICSCKEITSQNNNETAIFLFNLHIKRGFRHQIRCHMSWIGFPILNDLLYNTSCNAQSCGLQLKNLALCANALHFTCQSRKEIECRIKWHELELFSDSV